MAFLAVTHVILCSLAGAEGKAIRSTIYNLGCSFVEAWNLTEAVLTHAFCLDVSSATTNHSSRRGAALRWTSLLSRPG
jgi:hypothetical protein